jgi:hypothetical protein
MELGTPPRNLAERVFRFSIYFFLSSVILGGILFLAKVHEHNKLLIFIGNMFAVIYILCFLYMLCYIVLKFVRNAVVKVAWWSLLAVTIFLLIYFLGAKI